MINGSTHKQNKLDTNNDIIAVILKILEIDTNIDMWEVCEVIFSNILCLTQTHIYLQDPMCFFINYTVYTEGDNNSQKRNI